MAEAGSELPPEGSRFPTDGRSRRSGAWSSLGVLPTRQSLGRGAASPVPLTRREFEAARLKIMVNQAARKVGPSTEAETRGPRRCPRCDAANDHAARYCDQCGTALLAGPSHWLHRRGPGGDRPGREGLGHSARGKGGDLRDRSSWAGPQ